MSPADAADARDSLGEIRLQLLEAISQTETNPLRYSYPRDFAELLGRLEAKVERVDQLAEALRRAERALALDPNAGLAVRTVQVVRDFREQWRWEEIDAAASGLDPGRRAVPSVVPPLPPPDQG